MRRAPVFTTALTAACALACLGAGEAVAQQAPANTAGLRYLSWPGKPAMAARPLAARAIAAPAAADVDAPAPVSVSRTLPLARLAPAPQPAGDAPRRGLTPASAWMPQGAPAPAPSVVAPVAAQPSPAQTAPQPYAAQAASDPAPAQTQPAPRPEPDQAAQIPSAPQPAPAAQQPAADPMAPRRDAAIFRLQRPQAAAPVDASTVAASQQTAQTAPAPDQSARYYSVHRQAGRHPDAIAAPQQTYLDALPVEMSQTPRSNDLAQPDGPPALIRNSNGSMRAVPQTEADNLP